MAISLDIDIYIPNNNTNSNDNNDNDNNNIYIYIYIAYAHIDTYLAEATRSPQGYMTTVLALQPLHSGRAFQRIACGRAACRMRSFGPFDCESTSWSSGA